MGTITFGDNAADIRTALGVGTASTLDVGTGANNVVQLDGSGNLPALSASTLTGISGGKVKQIVSTSNSTQFDFSNSSYADGIEVSITPSSTNSKIMVFYTDAVQNTTYNVALNIRIVRVDGSSNPTWGPYQVETSWSPQNMQPHTISFVDSPSTTSSIIYRMQYAHQSGTGRLSVNNTTRQIVAMEFDVS
jgi:hypothetical protein